MVEGDHHNTPQIVSRDPGVQMDILQQLCAPILALSPDAAIVVRGTESHVGKNANKEEAFARWLARKGVNVHRDPETRAYSWWHFRGLIGDTLIDATHHGRIGQRPWTKGNVVLNLAAEIFMEHAASGDRHPDLAFRSHLHRHYDTYRAHPVRVIQTPAFQLSTAYAHKVVPGVLADIGGVILTLEDGRAPDVQPVIFKPARPPIVEVA